MSEKVNFWDGVETTNGKKLSEKEKLQFCENFNQMLRTSPELAKIFFNTQVYHEIVNDVTTRGLHSEGVAIVAENLAMQKAILDGKSEIEVKVSGLLARALGYMHDLGHTPFGHDGEGALGKEMERFSATPEYKQNRVKMFGKEYTDNAGDTKAETMCYEHNETSALIGAKLLEKFAEDNGYRLSEQAIQYIKTGILAHSTSRVKEEPDGIEQKAVRLADKIAYIPQDFLDLLKQDVLTIDDLSPEEQALLGLNEEQFTEKENQMYESLTLPEDRAQYREKRKQHKQELKYKLRTIHQMPEKIKMNLFRQLDVKIAEMQAEIARRCFITEEGEIKLDGRKERIDFFEKAVNKGEIPKNHEITVEEMQGIALFKKMRDAQKLPMENQERKMKVNDTARAYSEFLKEKYEIDPMLVTLWVTKAKYQDAFIKGELLRISQDQDGKQKQETLDDMNRKIDKAWEIKTVFQFFYSNIEQMPQEFRDRYQKGTHPLCTPQEAVAEFIASFTNKGIEELYAGLLERKLVVSRKEAIQQLQEKRPDLDVKRIANEDKKWQNPQNPEEVYKVLANDVLEFLYEENVGNTIVRGKNQIPERRIPQIQHVIAIRDDINATRKIERQPVALTSLIELSKRQLNARDIQCMVENIREKQNSQQIQQHIEKLKSDEGR